MKKSSELAYILPTILSRDLHFSKKYEKLQSKTKEDFNHALCNCKDARR